jgi:hypothetical protein
MSLSKKVIWEQVSPEDAESRVQQAFEMLLGEEFGLTDCARLGTAIDQCFSNDYNQGNETTINIKGNRHQVKSIPKVDP